MTPESDRAAVLVAAARTPVGKYLGALSERSAVELGALAVRETFSRLGQALEPDHVFLANVAQAGNGQNPARAVAVGGGLSSSVTATTVNDVCLASLTATGLAASLIRAGELETALVGGFESMSRAPHASLLRRAPRLADVVGRDLLVNDGLSCALSGQGMGEMSDHANVRLGIPRSDQDAFAAESHRRASAARSDGLTAKEMFLLPELGEDEGIRPDTTRERLAELRPAFTAEGSITAGNSSQMSDAAAVGVLTSREYARRNGLPQIVEVVGRAMVAGPDYSLHLKPADAARRLLANHRLVPDDIGLWELNEAFAGVALASIEALRISHDRVNVLGGAIALGHPLAASGFRMVISLAFRMMATNTELGVVTMCGGGGQGEAILLRNANR